MICIKFLGVTKILAIESSCDDTSASVIENGTVLSNETMGQLIHQTYGGVVPELASRQHHINIIPTVQAALDKSGTQLSELSAIAYTKGPGLVGSLLVGVTFAKTLAKSLDIPSIAVNHLHAHIFSHFAEDPKPNFPFLCLTVSGGHTQIVKVNSYTDLEVLGSTLDDAAGEAFDKIGKMLGLPYPAGPIIDNLAQQGQPTIRFSEPEVKDYNFSFSGLKTSVLYHLRHHLENDPQYIQKHLNDICASVQNIIVNTLIKKLVKAAEDTGIKEIGIAGGVSANSLLRKRVEALSYEYDWNLYIPAFQYCTDNAGMIAVLAYQQYLAKDFAPIDDVPSPKLGF